MSDISSINFEKSIPINTQHNERIIPPSYLIGKNFEVNRSSAEALALKQSMINRAIENYNKHKKPKAPPFKAKSYEWSAVVNLKPSSTMQDLENLAQHLQDKYGFQCYQIAIHKDEGHKDEDGNEVLNLHAHLEFITLDKDTGINKFNRRDIKYQTLRDIQTETAQILGMRRGIDKRLSGAKRVKPRVWAKMKESEKGERKKLLKNVKSKHEHELGEKFTIEQVTQKFNEILLQAQESKKLREQTERDKETITELRNILADLRDKEPAKTAENQKNNENLYTAEQIKDLFDFEYELNQQANTIDKDIKEFDKKEKVLMPDAKQRKLKEIGVNTSNLLDKITKNTHLESFFSFENCKEKVQKAIKWLKDKGLSLTKTQNTGLQR